jgi:hypothetical protein
MRFGVPGFIWSDWRAVTCESVAFARARAATLGIEV